MRKDRWYGRNKRYVNLIVVALVVLAGCTMAGKGMVPPKIKIAGIGVKDVQLFETRFRVELRVINPNDMPLDIRGIDCELELVDHKVASGVTDQKTSIPGLGTAVISVDLYASVVDWVQGIRGLQDREVLKYRITGRVHVRGGPMAPSTFPFSSEGELPLQ